MASLSSIPPSSTLADSSNPTVPVPIPPSISEDFLSLGDADSDGDPDHEDADGDGDGDSDIDLSDAQIADLLQRASRNLLMQRQPPGTTITTTTTVSPSPAHPTLNFPKLDPGPNLPKAPIPLERSASSSRRKTTTTTSPTALIPRLPPTYIPPTDSRLSNQLPLLETHAHAHAHAHAPSKRSSKDQPPTAGPQWFDLPRTTLTPEVKQDLQLLQLRGALDPKRFYKQGVMGNRAFPEYFQMGTIIEGNTEFFSSRLTKKERKQTILEETLAAHETTARLKRKAKDIDAAKRSGRRDFYKKMKSKRRKEV